VIDDVVRRIETLHHEYMSYLERPEEIKWRRCLRAHDAVVRSLDSDTRTLIDRLIAEQVDASNATPSAARARLERAAGAARQLEHQLGRDAGFREGELRALMSAGRRALRQAEKGGEQIDVPTSSQSLLDALGRLRNQIRHAVLTSRDESRKTKSSHRDDAREYASGQLYMVASIALNAQRQQWFDVSYAISIAMAGAHPRRRSQLKIPTHLRPSDDATIAGIEAAA
jgi:hypothetical protein